MSSTLALHSVAVLSAALVLGIAGVAKLVRPAFTTLALATAGLPASAGIVRMLAVVEIVVTVDSLGWGGAFPSTAVTALYAGFALFSALLLHRDPGASCGCFGTNRTIGPVHIVVNTVVAVIAALAVARGTAALPELLRDGPWAAPVPVLLIVAVTALLVLLLTRTTRRETPVPSRPEPGRIVPTTVRGRLVPTASSVRPAPPGRGVPDHRLRTDQDPDVATDHREDEDEGEGRDGEGDGGDEENDGITTLELEGSDTVLLFLSSTCLTCRGIWHELHRPRRTLLPRTVDLVILVDRDADPRPVDDLAPAGFPTIRVERGSERWGVPGAPWAIRVDGRTGGVLAEGTAETWAEFRSLLGL